MRRNSLRPLPKLKDKADRALQDYFRRHKSECEMCGGQYQVAHHFIHKKLSNYLRYDIANLIFVCNPCHSKFHSFPEPTYPAKVYKMRGDEWLDYIETHRRLMKKFTREELEEIIRKFSV